MIILPHGLTELADAAARNDAESLASGVSQLRAEDYEAFNLSQVAVHCKISGFRDIAESILLQAAAAHPTTGVLFFELGVIYMLTGRHDAAAEAFISACRCDPGDARFAADLILALHNIGAHPEAAAELARARTLPDSDAARLDQLEQFGRYLQEFPRGRGLHIIAEVRRRYDWVDTDRVAREIGAAMDEGRGFSLVRLGDGEGPCARIGAEDEARYAGLYAWLRREWATLLFGADFDPAATGYAALAETLMETCAQADIAGVPYAKWLEHEYAISSQRGVPGLLNVHRWFLKRAETEAPRPLLCDQLIHINLHREGHLEPIIRRSKRIGLISSNAQLPDMLKARFDLDEVELFKIPAERYSSGLRDAEALAGVHFPYAFWDITRRLSMPQHGRVVLIAAGTLAKFYAATVKAHGGIALDVGSLVDGWMKIASRPGYEGGIAM